MATRKTVAKRTSTAMTSIQEQMAAEVGGITSQIEQTAANRIKWSDGQFSFPDGSTNPGPLDVVIVDFASLNQYPRYNPKTKKPPTCFALGKNIKELKPSTNAPHPESEDCASCPLNVFGSDGDGKACSNTRQLAVVAPDATDADSPMMKISISPTSLKHFDAYVATVAKLHKVPPVGVVTELTLHPKDIYFTLHFGNPRPNPNLEIHFSRRLEAELLLEQEPRVETAETSTVKAPVRKKATARRR